VATILDLISSIIFGGVILLIVLDANRLAAENHSVYNGDMMVQEMLTSTAQILEGELRNMGCGLDDSVASVLQADSTSVTFLAALGYGSVNIDTIKYELGDTLDLKSTPNEKDRLLYRTVRGQQRSSIGAVTGFGLRYLNVAGDTLAVPVPSHQLSEIHTIEVTLEVQNPAAPYRDRSMVKPGERNALYSTSLWQQTRLASQNLRR
jgi:hypothetical protein